VLLTTTSSCGFLLGIYIYNGKWSSQIFRKLRGGNFHAEGKGNCLEAGNILSGRQADGRLEETVRSYQGERIRLFQRRS